MKYYILFTILFKVLCSTRAIESSNQYDITNALHDTIVGLFQTVKLQNLSKIIASVINSDPIHIETSYNFTMARPASKRPARFSGLRITNSSFINPRVSYEFINNKMNLYSPQFELQLFGEMKLDNFSTDDFYLAVHFSECTINTIRQTNDGSFSLIDLQYDYLNIESYGSATGWPTFTRNMEHILPSILRTLLSRNQNFLDALGAIHNQSMQHITSKHPRFFGHEYMYHYLIPNAFIGSIQLRDIVVKGLHNFHTLTSTTNSNTSTSILKIKDIRGSFILEDVSRTPTSSLELHFAADFLSISVNQKTNRVSVKASNYFFFDKKYNTFLSKVQSDVIMDEVERRIGSSLMPSMKYQNQKSKRSNSFPCDENLLRQILSGTSFNPDNKISTRKSTYFDLTTATTPQKKNSSDEYDITNTLKNIIVGLFENFRTRNVPQIIRQMNSFNYKSEYNNCRDLCLVRGYLEKSRIWFGFHNKTLQMNSAQFFLHLTGTVRIENYEHGFGSRTKYDGCVITVVEPKTPFEFPIVDFQYKNENIIFNGDVIYSPYTCPAEQVKKEIKSSIKDMIKGKFWNKLTECFDYQPTKDIISKYTHFLGHEQEYYYLIPEAPFGTFRLSNIIVNGLWNYHSLFFTDEPEVLTLEMKNIQGSLTLDESATGSSVELNFFVDSLSIGVTWNTSQINVEARNYSVFRTKINTKLSDLHSQPIIECIESAIASSIMPSMKFLKTTRVSPFSGKSKMEKSFRKLLIEKSFQSDEKDIEQSHNKCNQISFEGNRSSTKLPHSITINNNLHYHLSFPNLTINKFISGNQSHPEQIQCSLLDHSMFNHLINVVPFGKLLQNNDEGKSINVNFHFSAPFLNVSVTKRNNSKENDSCEFKISNNQDIEIHSSRAPESNLTGSHDEQLEIQKKINTALMSMTKERIVRTVKSIVCLPFDVCTQSAKIIDKFFSSFVDKVLKKCSLRRNKT